MRRAFLLLTCIACGEDDEWVPCAADSAPADVHALCNALPYTSSLEAGPISGPQLSPDECAALREDPGAFDPERLRFRGGLVVIRPGEWWDMGSSPGSGCFATVTFEGSLPAAMFYSAADIRPVRVLIEPDEENRPRWSVREEPPAFRQLP